MEDKYEKLGQAIDSLENLAFALKMSLPDKMHVEQLRLALPELVTTMKEGFVEATGQNPWYEVPDED